MKIVTVAFRTALNAVYTVPVCIPMCASVNQDTEVTTVIRVSIFAFDDGIVRC